MQHPAQQQGSNWPGTFFFMFTGGAHPPPAGHTQTAGQSPTAGGRRQSLTDEGRLTHPISGGAQRLDQKKRGAPSVSQ
jgi:hypothetical protein